MQKTKATKKEYLFSPSALKKEAKTIRWPHWLSGGDNKGILKNTAEVIGFSAITALFLWICNFGAIAIFR